VTDGIFLGVFWKFARLRNRSGKFTFSQGVNRKVTLSASSFGQKQRIGGFRRRLVEWWRRCLGWWGAQRVGENEEEGEGITWSCLPRSEDDGGGLSVWIRVDQRRSKVIVAFWHPAVDGKGWSLINSASCGLRRGRLLRWPLHPAKRRGGGARLGRWRKGRARHEAAELGHTSGSVAQLNRARAGTVWGAHSKVAAAAACRPRPLARRTWRPDSNGPRAGRRLGRRGPRSGLRARPS
jgi:hypothetical protein